MILEKLEALGRAPVYKSDAAVRRATHEMIDDLEVTPRVAP